MSNRRNTPRVAVIQDLRTVIGKRVSTSLSPTHRARLIRYDEKWAYFKVVENRSKARGLDWGKYNHCAGQIMEVPTKMIPSMCWLLKQGQR